MQTIFPVEVIKRQNAAPNGTRFSILIQGYNEPFQFTLPWQRALQFEVGLYGMYPKSHDDWSYGLGT